MARLILFIILCLVLYAILHFFIKDIPTRNKKLNKETEPEELVQDPYCQTYIPKRMAIRKRLSGKNYYFCKKECLEKFTKMEIHKKLDNQ
jgi:YHS domain-containing protein